MIVYNTQRILLLLGGRKSAYLYVIAHVYDAAFVLIFRYRKAVIEPLSMTMSMAAATWYNEVAGVHEYNVDFILYQYVLAHGYLYRSQFACESG